MGTLDTLRTWNARNTDIHQDAAPVSTVPRTMTTQVERIVAMGHGEGSASAPQVRYINVLIDDLTAIDPEGGHAARVWSERQAFTGGREGTASAWITRLKARIAAVKAGTLVVNTVLDVPEVGATKPKPAYDPYDDIPNGYYAYPGTEGTDDVKFFRVSRKDWRGDNGRDYTFIRVSAMASDTAHPIRHKNPILDHIRAVGPQACALLYGRTIGRCCRCGRTLTDADSRANGIGPDCAGKGMF